MYTTIAFKKGARSAIGSVAGVKGVVPLCSRVVQIMLDCRGQTSGMM